MVRISLIFLFIASCSSPNVSNMQGYTVDNKPYRGTNTYKRDYVKPYWQCVQFNRNVDCDVE